MQKSKVPTILWDNCLEMMAELRSNMTLNLSSLDGDPPHTKLTGDMDDISCLVNLSGTKRYGIAIWAWKEGSLDDGLAHAQHVLKNPYGQR